MNDQATLLAGAARLDITPPLGTLINGDFVTHYAQTIHDPLYAKALWLETSSEALVFVVVDICVMGQELIDEAKVLIGKIHGIAPAAIMISSTHTHAGGSVEEVHLVPADLAYRRKMPAWISEAVGLAKIRKKAAKLAFGSVQAPEHQLCRRFWMQEGYIPINPVTGKRDTIKTNPFGVENQILRPVAVPDPELCFLAVQGLDGNWISILGNYSMHYVGDWENGTVTADYFGTFSEALKKELRAEQDFVGILTNGTSGDINIWDFLREKNYPEAHFAKSKLIGEDLAAKLTEQIPDLKWDSHPKLGSSFTIVEVKRRLPDEQELAIAREKVAKGDYENLQPNQEGWEYLYAREQVLLAEYPSSAECPIQIFHIGNGRVGALPGEIFSETGLMIKEAFKGTPYFTVCLANGNLGYIPPAHELEKGGYETWRCRISNLDLDAEETIRKKLLDLLAFG
ncbi:hypothetical protein [Cyclobacterium jeungdonense]|uniref:Neutral/alkaline non-lysosomal ceramidase N-terminal domain-containing protein n=1 Tax=Cyclobacterium jeungdonense TaxID=708087 RepID=A0ABT8CA41_9BACT|nr:hypothetical protein [Cyclobacterium jeungdonense]MDN3689366.1 hypothetical protein [Cyclobacterium jeungdonense]